MIEKPRPDVLTLSSTYVHIRPLSFVQSLLKGRNAPIWRNWNREVKLPNICSDSSHLVKPIHADVLLRIESTNSESSRGDEAKNNNNSTKPNLAKDAAAKNVKKLELIEATQNVEISKREQNSPKSHKKSLNELVDSNDEGKSSFI